MSWQGFYRESVRYMEPKGYKQWICFFLALPTAWIRFQWLCLLDMVMKYR